MTQPSLSTDAVASVDADGMREIDRQMIEVLGVTLLQMMENAGRSLATVVREEFDPASVLVLAGSGGNGGGGLVAARHLTNAGVRVRVLLTADRARFSDAAAHQLGIVERMGVEVATVDAVWSIGDDDVVVDAMVGYSLRGSLSGGPASAVEILADANPAGIVSLDVPSGMSAGGETTSRGVVADVTVTLCLPKVGLERGNQAGRLFLADISVPASIVEAVTGGVAPSFVRGPILELR